jgi:hypothetical protein
MLASFTGTSSALDGYSMRPVLNPANYPSGTVAGTKIRVTLNQAAAGPVAVSVGHVGASAPNMEATPVPLVFTGNVGEANFAFNPVKPLVLATETTGPAGYAASVPGLVRHYKAATNEYGLQNVSGYASVSTHVLIEKIEILGA